MRKTLKKGLILLSLLLALLLLSIILGYEYLSDPFGSGEVVRTVKIEEGMSITEIGELLAEENLIHSADLFYWRLRLFGDAHQIKWGTYEISDRMSLDEIIALLKTGKHPTIPITIPEGYNILEIGDYLSSLELVESAEEFIEYCKDPMILEHYQIPATSVEGYLMPDTYHIPVTYTAKQIISMMMDEFFINFSPDELAAKLADLNLSFHEMVTLASLVEEETGVPGERELVAGVFYNRVKKHNMKLECDPTVAYSLKLEGKWQGNLKSSMPRNPDARRSINWEAYDSPYNTYKYYGFPPTPISNPGKDSIQAALNPSNTDYVFFMARFDGTGGHYFSKTAEEHNQAIRRARINQRNFSNQN